MKEKPIRRPGYAVADVALVRAARQGNLGAARAALSSGANVDAVVENETALSMAVYNDYEDLAKSLIDVGANVALRGVGGMPPLVAAAAGAASDKTLRLLVNAGADINRCVDPSGMTALMSAAKAGCDRIVALLLHLGADPEIVDLLGRAALDYAKQARDAGKGSVNAMLIETAILQRRKIATPAASARPARGGAHI